MGGVVYGVGATVTAALMTIPVDWIGALVIGIGGAAAGYYTGKTVKHYYNQHGQRLDLVKARV